MNCLRWSKDGRKIATGDSEGYVSLWGVDKEFAVQRNEDINKLEKLMLSNQSQATGKSIA